MKDDFKIKANSQNNVLLANVYVIDKSRCEIIAWKR